MPTKEGGEYRIVKNKKHGILVVDNDAAVLWVLQKAFSDDGYDVDTALDGRAALNRLDETPYPLVVMDIMMPVMDGLAALKRIREMPNPPEVIMITAHSSMENTIEAMKLGAFDYIVKPFDIDDVLSLARRAIDNYMNRQEPGKPVNRGPSESIIGNSEVMRGLYKLLGRMAHTDTSVLITGETGTGKDLFARAIHFHSARNRKPFITVNCASIPAELLESELFGHEKGAFTGATGRRVGKCELADGGTLFLDEIGAMRLDLQAKILRFLQHSEFERVGSSHTHFVDVRVIAATNADLGAMVVKGGFREDLFYRLMVVPMHIPPLRERREDIPALAKYFAERYNGKYGLGYTLSQEAQASLAERDWPGNVRELENYIHRMVVLQSDTAAFGDNVPVGVPEGDDTATVESVADGLIGSGRTGLLDAARERIEKPLLSKVLARVGGNQSKAAALLGISRNTLRKMLDKYGMNAK
ncbi:MAG: sigma-54-dependent Fis family transcriptional regulator [Candidatus Latescibacteria bacterium]|nr:sigma-54-dependent Fis family transcriptional regulator [Candidatus Latescibacterota bacterium]